MADEEKDPSLETSTELDKQQLKETLKKHFEDRTAALESAFKPKGQKTSGVSEGYVASRESDGSLFMIKKAIKNSSDRNTGSEAFDSMNFVNEFVTGPLYKRMLYDRAPIIEAVQSDSPASRTINLRSKFLNQFQTVSEFTKGYPGSIGKKADKLKDVQGAEKLFASMLLGGEYDIHAGNIGVMKVKDDAGKDIQVFSKIDHGWSASQFFSKSQDMMENFATAYEQYGYYGRIDLNVSKLKEAVDENLKITDEEIERVIKSRTQQLKTMGFDIRGLEIPVWENDKQHDFNAKPPKYKTFNNFEALENHYIKQYKAQKQSMQSLSQTLGVIEKIDYPSPEWKNGQWLSEIRGQDPIQWCKKKSITIDGIKPNLFLKKQREPKRATFASAATTINKDSLDILASSARTPNPMNRSFFGQTVINPADLEDDTTSVAATLAKTIFAQTTKTPQAKQMELAEALKGMKDTAKGLNEKIESLDTALKPLTPSVERERYIKNITDNAQSLASRSSFYMSLANKVPYDEQPLVKLEGYMTVINDLGSDLVANFLDPKQKEELQKSLAQNKEACDKILENDPAAKEKLDKAYDKTIAAITSPPKTNLREKFGITENEFEQIQGALSKSIKSINQSISDNIRDAKKVTAAKDAGRLIKGLAGRARQNLGREVDSRLRRAMAKGKEGQDSEELTEETATAKSGLRRLANRLRQEAGQKLEGVVRNAMAKKKEITTSQKFEEEKAKLQSYILDKASIEQEIERGQRGEGRRVESLQKKREEIEKKIIQSTKKVSKLSRELNDKSLGQGTQGKSIDEISKSNNNNKVEDYIIQSEGLRARDQQRNTEQLSSNAVTPNIQTPKAQKQDLNTADSLGDPELAPASRSLEKKEVQRSEAPSISESVSTTSTESVENKPSQKGNRFTDRLIGKPRGVSILPQKKQHKLKKEKLTAAKSELFEQGVTQTTQERNKQPEIPELVDLSGTDNIPEPQKDLSLSRELNQTQSNADQKTRTIEDPKQSEQAAAFRAQNKDFLLIDNQPKEIAWKADPSNQNKSYFEFSFDGVKNQSITSEIKQVGKQKYRQLDIKPDLGEGKDVGFSFAAFDQNGNRVSAKDPIYLDVDYKDGKLVECKISGRGIDEKNIKLGKDTDPLTVERDGQTYSLGITYGQYKEFKEMERQAELQAKREAETPDMVRQPAPNAAQDLARQAETSSRSPEREKPPSATLERPKERPRESTVGIDNLPPQGTLTRETPEQREAETPDKSTQSAQEINQGGTLKNPFDQDSNIAPKRSNVPDDIFDKLYEASEKERREGQQPPVPDRSAPEQLITPTPSSNNQPSAKGDTSVPSGSRRGASSIVTEDVRMNSGRTDPKSEKSNQSILTTTVDPATTPEQNRGISAPIIRPTAQSAPNIKGQINHVDDKGQTELHRIALADRDTAARTSNNLLNQGADLNIRDSQGKTALEYAVANVNQRLVKSLLNGGAEPFNAQGQPLRIEGAKGLVLENINKQLTEAQNKFEVAKTQGVPKEVERRATMKAKADTQLQELNNKFAERIGAQRALKVEGATRDAALASTAAALSSTTQANDDKSVKDKESSAIVIADRSAQDLERERLEQAGLRALQERVFGKTSDASLNKSSALVPSGDQPVDVEALRKKLIKKHVKDKDLKGLGQEARRDASAQRADEAIETARGNAPTSKEPTLAIEAGPTVGSSNNNNPTIQPEKQATEARAFERIKGDILGAPKSSDEQRMGRLAAQQLEPKPLDTIRISEPLEKVIEEVSRAIDAPNLQPAETVTKSKQTEPDLLDLDFAASTPPIPSRSNAAALALQENLTGPDTTKQEIKSSSSRKKKLQPLALEGSFESGIVSSPYGEGIKDSPLTTSRISVEETPTPKASKPKNRLVPTEENSPLSPTAENIFYGALSEGTSQPTKATPLNQVLSDRETQLFTEDESRYKDAAPTVTSGKSVKELQKENDKRRGNAKKSKAKAKDTRDQAQREAFLAGKQQDEKDASNAIGKVMQEAQEAVKANKTTPQGPSQEFQDAREDFIKSQQAKIAEVRQAQRQKAAAITLQAAFRGMQGRAVASQQREASMLEKIQQETAARVQAAKAAGVAVKDERAQRRQGQVGGVDGVGELFASAEKAVIRQNVEREQQLQKMQAELDNTRSNVNKLGEAIEKSQELQATFAQEAIEAAKVSGQDKPTILDQEVLSEFQKDKEKYETAKAEIEKSDKQMEELGENGNKPITDSLKEQFNKSISTAGAAYVESNIDRTNKQIEDATKEVVQGRQAAERAQERAEEERRAAVKASAQARSAEEEAKKQVDRKTKESDRDRATHEALEQFTQRAREVKDDIGKLKQEIQIAEETRAKYEKDSEQAGQKSPKLLEKLDQALKEPKEKLTNAEKAMQEIEKRYAELQEKGNIARRDLGEVRNSLDNVEASVKNTSLSEFNQTIAEPKKTVENTLKNQAAERQTAEQIQASTALDKKDQESSIMPAQSVKAPEKGPEAIAHAASLDLNQLREFTFVVLNNAKTNLDKAEASSNTLQSAQEEIGKALLKKSEQERTNIRNTGNQGELDLNSAKRNYGEAQRIYQETVKGAEGEQTALLAAVSMAVQANEKGEGANKSFEQYSTSLGIPLASPSLMQAQQTQPVIPIEVQVQAQPTPNQAVKEPTINRASVTIGGADVRVTTSSVPPKQTEAPIQQIDIQVSPSPAPTQASIQSAQPAQTSNQALEQTQQNPSTQPVQVVSSPSFRPTTRELDEQKKKLNPIQRALEEAKVRDAAKKGTVNIDQQPSTPLSASDISPPPATIPNVGEKSLNEAIVITPPPPLTFTPPTQSSQEVGSSAPKAVTEGVVEQSSSPGSEKYEAYNAKTNPKARDFLKAVEKGEVGKITQMVKEDPKILESFNEQKETAFHVAVKYDQTQALNELMQKVSNDNKDVLRIQDRTGNTALHIAGKLDRLNMAKGLVRKDRELLLLTNNDFKTPDKLAAENGFVTTGRFLKEEWVKLMKKSQAIKRYDATKQSSPENTQQDITQAQAAQALVATAPGARGGVQLPGIEGRSTNAASLNKSFEQMQADELKRRANASTQEQGTNNGPPTEDLPLSQRTVGSLEDRLNGALTGADSHGRTSHTAPDSSATPKLSEQTTPGVLGSPSSTPTQAWSKSDQIAADASTPREGSQLADNPVTSNQSEKLAELKAKEEELKVKATKALEERESYYLSSFVSAKASEQYYKHDQIHKDTMTQLEHVRKQRDALNPPEQKQEQKNGLDGDKALFSLPQNLTSQQQSFQGVVAGTMQESFNKTQTLEMEQTQALSRTTDLFARTLEGQLEAQGVNASSAQSVRKIHNANASELDPHVGMHSSNVVVNLSLGHDIGNSAIRATLEKLGMTTPSRQDKDNTLTHQSNLSPAASHAIDIKDTLHPSLSSVSANTHEPKRQNSKLDKYNDGWTR